VFVCVFFAILDSVQIFWSLKNSWTTKQSYNQRSLSFSWSFFIVLSTAPKMSNSVSQYGCRKVNDRHAACPPKLRLAGALRVGVFLFFFCCPVSVWQKWHNVNKNMLFKVITQLIVPQKIYNCVFGSEGEDVFRTRKSKVTVRHLE